jgi:hypothetical protein
VIPSTTSRRTPIPYDTVAYRDRACIERMWCRLKDWRRLATRYDKLAPKRCLLGRDLLLLAQLSEDPRVKTNKKRALLLLLSGGLRRGTR